MRAADGAGQDRAVLRKDIDRTPVDLAEAGHDAVRRQLLFRHAEIRALGFRKHKLFDEAAGVQKRVDPLAGRELAFGALAGGDF